jgi:hypothetical protein
MKYLSLPQQIMEAIKYGDIKRLKKLHQTAMMLSDWADTDFETWLNSWKEEVLA